MLRRETLVCDTIEEETGIANLIVWAAIIERFRRGPAGEVPILLYSAASLTEVAWLPRPVGRSNSPVGS
jgi:hypothetical protein